jgi:TrmH family RNA methyltransferase
MVSKNRRKWVNRLHQKKYREQEGLFLAEGEKIIEELLTGGCELHECWISADNGEENTAALIEQRGLGFLNGHLDQCLTASSQDMIAVSQMTQPPGVLAVFHQPQPGPIAEDQWIVAVDRLQDPGNFGTLIRSCDWFGIRHILASEGTVDTYNSKVVQSSMGALARVAVHRVDLPSRLKETDLPVLGTYMEGENLYTAEMPEAGILLMGNESQGIHQDYNGIISGRIRIPNYRKPCVESLNVGVAAAVILGEIRRRFPGL